MRKILHTVQKSLFHVQNVGYHRKQILGQICGPLFSLSIRQSRESLGEKYFHVSFFKKLCFKKLAILFAWG